MSPGSAYRAHLVMLPFPSLGNINPMFQFAIRLASPDLLVTFVHSQRNYSLLLSHRQQSHDSLDVSASNPHLRIAAIPDATPQDQNSRPSVAQIIQSAADLEHGFDSLLLKLSREEPPVSGIVSASFLGWSQDVATKHGLPRVDFWASTATAFSYLFHAPLLISKGFLPIIKDTDDPDKEESIVTCIPGISPIYQRDFPDFLQVEDLTDPPFQFSVGPFRRLREAACAVIYTFYELESEVIDGLREQKLSIFPVGPLLPSVESVEASLFKADDRCLPWLDKHAPFSVLYVAFGSFNTLSHDEVHELALGLESSGHPFLWVLRPESEEGSVADILPEDFLSRIHDRGLVIDWAPQVSVLAHQAVGGFFTHCGWNSSLEGIYFGVPLLGWPKHADQKLNSSLIADKWKNGLALRLRKEGGVEISKEAVEEGVRALMEGSGDGRSNRVEEMKDAARRAVAGDSPCFSRNALEAFRGFLLNIKA